MSEVIEVGKCWNCNNNTALKVSFRKYEDGEVINTYFDLCEACKLEKNCFTCLYSKAWYLRYKGRCDQIFGSFEEKRPDCKLYPTKQIGKKARDFWEHLPCKKHQRGDATKDEFDEYNCRW